MPKRTIIPGMPLFDYIDFTGLGPQLVGRRASTVVHKGESGEATVTGIAVDRTGDEDTTDHVYTYRLDVRSALGTFTCGVRQRPAPRREDAHVGAVVPVLVHKRKVVLDWYRHLGEVPEGKRYITPWRMVSPPEPGVRDPARKGERKRIASARQAELTILALRDIQTAFGEAVDREAHVQLRYADTGEVEQRALKLRRPDYAAYLFLPGLRMPAGVDKDGTRVTVDWEGAANDAHIDPSPPPVDAALTAAPPIEEPVNAFLKGLFG